MTNGIGDAMSGIVDGYVDREVEVLFPGPKGVIKIKGKLIRADEDFLEIEEEKKGLLGGKSRKLVLSRYGIIGFRVEG